MLKSLKFLDGYFDSKFKCPFKYNKSKKFEFKKINIIVGDNSAGKTVLLDAISRLLHIENSIYPLLDSEKLISRFSTPKLESLEVELTNSENYLPFGVNATFLQKKFRNNDFYGDKTSSELFLNAVLHATKPKFIHCGGEDFYYIWNELTECLSYESKYKDLLDESTSYIEAFNSKNPSYKIDLSKGERSICILMDEPDHEVSFVNKRDWLRFLVEEWSVNPRIQIFLVTHNPFFIEYEDNPEVNIIDLGSSFTTRKSKSYTSLVKSTLKSVASQLK